MSEHEFAGYVFMAGFIFFILGMIFVIIPQTNKTKQLKKMNEAKIMAWVGVILITFGFAIESGIADLVYSFLATNYHFK